MIIKWLIFSQQKIRFKTLMLRSDLCDSSDIFVKEWATVEGDNDDKIRKKKIIFNIQYRRSWYCYAYV